MGVSSTASPRPSLTKQPAWPAAGTAGVQRAMDGASPACHTCAETHGLGTGPPAQVGDQSRSILPLALSLQDTGAADMGLQ